MLTKKTAIFKTGGGGKGKSGKKTTKIAKETTKIAKKSGKKGVSAQIVRKNKGGSKKA